MKYQIMLEHKNAVKNGNYLVAKRLLRMLMYGYIELDLGDIDNQVEAILDRCGAKLVFVSTRTGCATYKIA